MKTRGTNRTGFSMVELLVVIAVLTALIALLVPALASVHDSGVRARSMTNLKQVAQWMSLYSSENRGVIVPSQFDYSSNPYPGKVRSNPSSVGLPDHVGTWTDILWFRYSDVAFPMIEGDVGHDYTLDSPDRPLYDRVPGFDKNPLRSVAPNTRGPEKGLPGMFAANDFFDARTDPVTYPWWTTAQINSPAESLYLIDSSAGETITDDHDDDAWVFDSPDRELDFRYGGEAVLILLLDGSTREEGRFDDLEELEQRGVRVDDLDKAPSQHVE